MTDTLAVIALDAADYALLKQWNCDNILLDRHSSLETITGTRDVPLTTEVWPTVATGLSPEQHGLVADGEQQSWGNPVLDAASVASSLLLPDRFRVYAGELVQKVKREDGTGMTLTQTSASHPFPETAVYGWPGITDAEHLLEAWRWLALVKEGEISEDDSMKRLYENAGKEIGWMVGLADYGFPALGVHMHILDAAGHMYGNREYELRRAYQRVNRLLGVVREIYDEVLILSDHGIQVSWLGDKDVGNHSMRAFVASTIDEELPESVFDVRSWVERHRGPDNRTEASEGEMATKEEQLRNLGYIN